MDMMRQITCLAFNPSILSDDRSCLRLYITRLFKYIENFLIKKSDIFHISAQNIDNGYSLEPPRLGGSNEWPLSMF